MAKWTSLGHGMRRRMGAPSNHLESAGKPMTRNHPTSEEATEYARSAGSHRIPVDVVIAPAISGTLVPKQGAQAADPSDPGSKQNRQNIERIGASYSITAGSSVHLDPSASQVMANARPIPSVKGRNTPNFEMGIEASSL